MLSCTRTAEVTPKPAPQTSRDKAAEPLGALARGEPRTSLPIEEDDIVVGGREAPVTIVAFLDFECPFCMKGFETLEELRTMYPEESLRIAIKQLPLEFHKSAYPAALAAQAVQQAAGPRAAYQFSSAVFEERDLSGSGLMKAAKALGVDRALYTAFVEDPETSERIHADMALAASHGIDGTPAFFINGRGLRGAVPASEFQTKIDEELAYFKAHGSKGWAKTYAERVEANLRSSLRDAVLADDPRLYQVPVAASPTMGPSSALVTLVSFSDFECPYCKRGDHTVVELQKLYGAELRVAWKHLPLPFHKMAVPAARLSVLVQKTKGDEAFFEVARRLFDSSPDLSEPTLISLGKSFGLQGPELEAALGGKNAFVEERIAADQDLAEDLEAHGTPTFFINGRRVQGAHPLSHFQAVIDGELALARERVQSGTTREALYESIIREGVTPGVPDLVALDQLTETSQPSRGPKDAPYVIHVFSDFECPFCRRAEQTLTPFREKQASAVRWVWHDLPLPFHNKALPAARAGREAYRQKGDAGFWQMHDLLFGLAVSTSRVSPDELEAHAKELRLNQAEFKRALEGKRDESIEHDKQLALQLEIHGTPAFVVQKRGAKVGYVISGAQPARVFERALLRIEKANQPGEPAQRSGQL